ncbi:2-amino-4-hydroxy-6-hydroxymethyldihydropteridine diphosphokinase [Halomonas sp. MCCC 1A17488]|uniref:2-amino-4-hydroxy-6-hydroxymethyldihydropteridine pyrophosphokinase n=1 Tax=Billgrantia sulfidoxydans TaxID=2733484 RepID=A0ABX7WC86_9GAMM|nr:MULTISPECIES: 2-amino-4-hydroxy-6-hydroxymethyldihydropteridine diphosphokinase [Halomonas]MCE8017495.1 2-amino-4-hydroxy-6-hydroxymethyldihydropteridine diphosphokinase [Halomonas sp. MCCC 1A17488]MCG3240828.1 2-amino-4-hydroxy-6-hydroxymethyldihydropteridine diphosphokinase [Halomonas sp. MCCC 1A17488]QPP49341.1 2-amino-4-hydroxy-6-hydroxymethyldihydropteridine diphosphokinase [Halomonas sp. SS10-MC5]QTP56698.1 2-amino-4-hydroxy-6-hydroxymethyldihydropteridine diphosphokinase [Halomonas su
MTPHTEVYVGLGSNLDDPIDQVRRALDELDSLPLTRRVAASRLYASRPVGPQDQPDFVNAVAHLHTRLSPLALLDQLQALEQRHRRIRERRWGPRTLDLDLLLYGDETLALPRLQVPHREMTSRAFVLLPLLELAPHLQLPDGHRIAALAETLATAGEVEVLPDNAN